MSVVRFGDVARGFERVPSLQERERVVLLSDDRLYRSELADHLRREAFEVIHGSALPATLRRVPGWGQSWRRIEQVAAVLLDIAPRPGGALAEEAIALVDAVRRRDWSLPVVLLVRSFGSCLPAGGRSFGANMVFEGQPAASELTAAVLRLRSRDGWGLAESHAPHPRYHTPPVHGAPESAPRGPQPEQTNTG